MVNRISTISIPRSNTVKPQARFSQNQLYTRPNFGSQKRGLDQHAGDLVQARMQSPQESPQALDSAQALDRLVQDLQKPIRGIAGDIETSITPLQLLSEIVWDMLGRLVAPSWDGSATHLEAHDVAKYREFILNANPLNTDLDNKCPEGLRQFIVGKLETLGLMGTPSDYPGYGPDWTPTAKGWQVISQVYGYREIQKQAIDECLKYPFGNATQDDVKRLTFQLKDLRLKLTEARKNWSDAKVTLFAQYRQHELKQQRDALLDDQFSPFPPRYIIGVIPRKPITISGLAILLDVYKLQEALQLAQAGHREAYEKITGSTDKELRVLAHQATSQFNFEQFAKAYGFPEDRVSSNPVYVALKKMQALGLIGYNDPGDSTNMDNLHVIDAGIEALKSYSAI